MSKTIKTLIGIAILLILLPIAIYTIKFINIPLSINPTEWGAFGDYVGGLLTPIIAFFTLLVTVYIAIEIKKIEVSNSKKAIETTYVPQVVVQQDIFYIYSVKHNTSIRPTIFSYDKQDFQYLADNDGFYKPFGLNIYNIGLGPTKKIKISFEFETKETVDLLNNMNSEINADKRIVLEYKHGATGDGLLTYSGPDKEGGGRFTDIKLITEINHLLSVNVVDKPYTLIVPNAIQFLYGLLNYNWWQEEKRKFTTVFPSFYINMNFKDIGDNVFNKKFKIDFVFNGGSINTSMHQIKVEEVILH